MGELQIPCDDSINRRGIINNKTLTLYYISALQFAPNAIYIAGRKFTLYLYGGELYSTPYPAIQFHVNVKRNVWIIISPIPQNPAVCNCEIQSNKTAYRRVTHRGCYTVQKSACNRAGIYGCNLNTTRFNLHVKGEHSRLCYSVRTRGSNDWRS